MNIPEVVPRVMCVIAFLGLGSSIAACSPEEPATATSVAPPTADPSFPDKWDEVANNLSADMHEVGGETFGLDDWRMPSEAGKAQGFYGEARLGTKCIAIVSPGMMSEPDSHAALVSSRQGDSINDSTLGTSLSDIRSFFHRYRYVCE